MERLEALADPSVPILVARVHNARSLEAALKKDMASCASAAEAAADAFERAGDRRNACRQRGNVGFVRGQLGAYAESKALLEDAITMADRLGIVAIATHARHNLGPTLARLGRFAEAREVESLAARRLAEQGNVRILSASLGYLAVIVALAGDLEAALEEADAAVRASEKSQSTLPLALAARAFALLRLGRADEALVSASEAVRLASANEAAEEGEAFAWLLYAESLYATGRLEEARRVIAQARDQVMKRAAARLDERLRQDYLEKVHETARTLLLAREWLDQEPVPRECA
jgi:tetratricopeptide (TPR) repeat protein